MPPYCIYLFGEKTRISGLCVNISHLSCKDKLPIRGGATVSPFPLGQQPSGEVKLLKGSVRMYSGPTLLERRLAYAYIV